MNQKLENLYDYMLKIRNGEGSIALYQQYETDVKAVEAIELFELFNRLLEQESPKEILVYLDKLMHIFSQGLLIKQRKMPEGSALDFLVRENKAMEEKLTVIQTLMRSRLQDSVPADLLPFFAELTPFNTHYVKIQNVLFPHLEKADARCTGLKILWAAQDQAKATLKSILDRLPNTDTLDTELIVSIGNYFFAAYGLIQKEEMILFQVALDLFDQKTLALVKHQIAEFEPCFIEPLKVDEPLPELGINDFFSTMTGHLSFDQLKLMLDALPVDLTLIDEFDKVCYFNAASGRLFPRSAAVIGRDVRNCHPADSVHVVNEILSAFKNGTRQEAKFWIQMRGQFILIKYVALRDQHRRYRGCLEITQEISEIQALKGQRRLLDWN